MTWEKTRSPAVAKAGAQDIAIRFYFSDAGAIPPSVLRCTVRLCDDSGLFIEETDMLLASTTLTPAQRTQLAALLVALRDEALTRAGYVSK